MLATKGFKILEHTADEYVMAYGTTLEEAFESAALALCEVMTDSNTVAPIDVESIRIVAEDEPSLLYSWLEEFLIKFDAEGKIYSKFTISKIGKTKEGFYLNATAWGETYDPNKHPSRTGVKAMTYSRLEILKKHNKVTLKFILDI